MPQSKQVIVVNENDEPIGVKDFFDMKPEDIYRASGLWITNSKGDILLAKRAMTKKNDPGKWGPAVAGTIEKGETYASNIVKEAEEELGLHGIAMQEGPKTRTRGSLNYFGQWFTATIDKSIPDFTIEKEEVDEIRWFKPGEFIERVTDHPEEFLPNAFTWIDLFLK